MVENYFNTIARDIFSYVSETILMYLTITMPNTSKIDTSMFNNFFKLCFVLQEKQGHSVFTDFTKKKKKEVN